MNSGAKLSNRVVVITGASSGIGKHLAKHLAASGASVALAARRRDRLDSTVEEIERAGRSALAVDLDVADEHSVVEAFDRIERELKPIDTVIANAGCDAKGAAIDLSVDDFDWVMAVTLRGVFLTAREGARRMLQHLDPAERAGRIVLMSSITSQTLTPGLSAYSASKAAVNQLGRVMAKELVRSGINVNCILPGYIETELTEDAFGTESGQRFLNSFPRKRLVDLDELDGIVSYLCSDESAAVTGSLFTLDDGQSL